MSGQKSYLLLSVLVILVLTAFTGILLSLMYLDTDFGARCMLVGVAALVPSKALYRRLREGLT
jgi:hypothetical protein